MKDLSHINVLYSVAKAESDRQGEVFSLNNMTDLDIYENISRRTQGDIYIGVVGPVRSGKSTFIKRFMDLMVVPNVSNPYVRQRLADELPQSGAGRTVTTTEPKFVPAEAVNLQLAGGVTLRVRMVDCVGYLIPGAMGHTEDGKARMVQTPWFEEKIPFEQAAQMGTRKVITDHSTIGIVVTTDGSIGDIPRENYVEAEERVVGELAALNKPFVVVVNSTNPDGETAQGLAAALGEQYDVPVIAVNCEKMREETLLDILQRVLDRFPVTQVNFTLPGFTRGLSNDHWIKAGITSAIRNWAAAINTVEDVAGSAEMIPDGQIIKQSTVKDVDMGTGIAEVELTLEDGLFYRACEELMGEEVRNDYHFFRLLKEFAASKKAYDKLAQAIEQVESTGYGIVQPKLSEMVLEEPEVFRQGSKYGVRLRAKAPSLHIIKTDITTEVAPIVGTEKQSEDLVKYLLTEFRAEPAKIWDTNLFGKSLYEMVTEQMENKLTSVPENIRGKVQKSLQKISDEGREYYICIVI